MGVRGWETILLVPESHKKNRTSHPATYLPRKKHAGFSFLVSKIQKSKKHPPTFPKKRRKCSFLVSLIHPPKKASARKKEKKTAPRPTPPALQVSPSLLLSRLPSPGAPVATLPSGSCEVAEEVAEAQHSVAVHVQEAEGQPHGVRPRLEAHGGRRAPGARFLAVFLLLLLSFFFGFSGFLFCLVFWGRARNSKNGKSTQEKPGKKKEAMIWFSFLFLFKGTEVPDVFMTQTQMVLEDTPSFFFFCRGGGGFSGC